MTPEVFSVSVIPLISGHYYSCGILLAGKECIGDRSPAQIDYFFIECKL